MGGNPNFVIFSLYHKFLPKDFFYINAKSTVMAMPLKSYPKMLMILFLVSDFIVLSN